MTKLFRASITERGQLTLPAEIRQALGLKPGDKVDFVVEDGRILLKRPAFTLKSVAASVPPLSKKLEWSELVEIAHDDAAERTASKSGIE